MSVAQKTVTSNRTKTLDRRLALVRPGMAAQPGSLTQKFFQEGEAQEATGFKDAPLEFDDAPPADPELQFDSFDQVPKRRRPVIAIATVATFLFSSVAFVMAWRMYRTHDSGAAATAINPEVKAASVTFPSTSAAEPAPEVVPGNGHGNAAAPTPPQAYAVVPITTTADTTTAETTAGASAPAPLPSRAAEERVAPRPGVVSAPEEGQSERMVKSNASTSARGKSREETAGTAGSGEVKAKTDRNTAMRGFVWSPANRGLVPAGGEASSREEAAPSTAAPAASEAASPSASEAPRAPVPQLSETRKPTEPLPLTEPAAPIIE